MKTTGLSPFLWTMTLLLSACSGQPSETASENRNSNQANSNIDSQTNAAPRLRRNSTELRNAVVACLKQDVGAIGTVHEFGTLLCCRIVAVETGSGPLTYLVVTTLEDKNGKEHLHAEPLNLSNKYVANLTVLSEKPIVITDEDKE